MILAIQNELSELYKDSEEQIWAHLHRGVRLRPGGAFEGGRPGVVKIIGCWQIRSSQLKWIELYRVSKEVKR